MRLVLSATDATPGNGFTLAGGWSFAICDTHTGGTWMLQVQSPGEVWVDIDTVAFDEAGMIQFRTPAGQLCRFAGGTTGARIYCDNVLG